MFKGGGTIMSPTLVGSTGLTTRFKEGVVVFKGGGTIMSPTLVGALV